MAVGQVGIAGALDVAGLAAVEDRLAQASLARSSVHAAVLADALALESLLGEAGLDVGIGSHLALLLGGSGHQAERLLEQARLLEQLPDGLLVLAQGLLTVEQVGVFVTETLPLTVEVRRVLWDRTVALLRAARTEGWVVPPADLGRRLRRWSVQADPDGAMKRRRQAQHDADVDYRQRQDGLVDLFALGITGPNAQACLASIAARSGPVGPDDPRPAGQRRLDALVDLLTGRDTLFDAAVPEDDAGAADLARPGCPTCGCTGAGAGPRRACGCASGASVPCGTQVTLLVPLGAALGTTDEVARQVGYGPLDPDLLRQALLGSPSLRTTWVDQHGVPVAQAQRTAIPRRNDPADLRQVLLALATQPPPPPEQWQPRHPDDHHPAPPAPAPAAPAAHLPGPAVPSDAGAATGDETCHRRGHPAGTPGGYRVPGRLRRFLTARQPSCEWPGCGIRAACCDLDHDLAWPDGPTCACNLGPLCRRHHRTKQTGWTKTRTPTSTRWTSPTGRTWTSPSTHQPPAAPTRTLPPVHQPHWTDQLSPLQREHELHALAPDSPAFDDQPSTLCDDHEPHSEPHTDRLRARLRHHDTRWTLDLDDPYRWLPQPA